MYIIPRRKGRKCFMTIVFILIMSMFCSFMMHLKTLFDDKGKLDNMIFQIASEDISDEATFHSQNGQACVHPILSLWHPDVKKFFQKVPPLICSNDKNWVYLEKEHLYFDSDAMTLHGHFECNYTPLVRQDDFKTLQGNTITKIPNGFKITSDFAYISCESTSGKKYYNIIAGIAKMYDEGEKQPLKQIHNSLDLNILMFGFDSISRMTWLRNLPKSYEYFSKELKGITLQGYNIVGDGTPQALLPILTGKTEIELPEARRGFAGAAPVDGHPWIWKLLKNEGYVSQYGEDGADIGTFHYRMLGFQNQPTDHYMRPYQLEALKLYKHNKPYCLGSQGRHNDMFKWIDEFYSTYHDRKKFSFLFHSEYSHGYSSLLQVADNDLLDFLKNLNDKNVLNNTVLILMSDHGARFQTMRNSVQGKYEERLPFFSFAFPPWFEKIYPHLMKNFKSNAQKLTTPFDIHETLIDLVQYKGNIQLANQRGISLFQEIPLERSCSDAGIDNHWCACLKWESVPISSNTVRVSAVKLTEFINNLTSSMREYCHELSLQNITSAVEYIPDDKLLQFKKSKDMHGRVADLTDNMIADEKYYQITIVTAPNNAIFEGTVKHNSKYKIFTMNDKEISRINKYGNQPHCVMINYPHLRPYCHCKT